MAVGVMSRRHALTSCFMDTSVMHYCQLMNASRKINAAVARLGRCTGRPSSLYRVVNALRWAARGVVLALCLVPVAAVPAESSGPTIETEALFPGRAMLRIDGRRHLLEVGETSPEGVRLIAADARTAEVEFEGTRQRLAIGDRIAARYRPPPDGVSVRLLPGRDGIYRSTGSINGLPTTMTIDTGASSIALNRNLAARLGLDYRQEDQRTRVGTASGVVDAYRVRLDRVRVGAIERRNLAAMVIDADAPDTVLIGGTFLNTLELHREGATLMLVSPAP